ncbi:hypothetical protein ACFC3F_10370 [Microbacterium sp. NPDC055910]|uniref:hypothetical protein n=1 Tax=Microbacterium sp. NPDC055910 TaxID=3345659 RepID=UPI0035E2D329
MPAHVMVVLSNSKPELDAEFNDWYTNVHLVDVVNKLDGLESAQRFELAPNQNESAEYRYLAIYEIPEGKLEDAKRAQAYQRAERADALANGRKPWIESRAGELFDGEHRTWFFTALGEPYVKGSLPDPGEGDEGK